MVVSARCMLDIRPVEGCHEDPDPGDGAAELGLAPHPLREGEEQHEQRGHVGEAVHQHHPVNQLPILRISATFHTYIFSQDHRRLSSSTYFVAFNTVF